jgi:hypothetical protein
MKYLLLNPLCPEIFGGNITETEMLGALEEFGCKAIMSEGNTETGSVMHWYATSDSLEALQQMVNTVDLEGNIVEVNRVFDQILEVV